MKISELHLINNSEFKPLYYLCKPSAYFCFGWDIEEWYNRGKVLIRETTSINEPFWRKNPPSYSGFYQRILAIEKSKFFTVFKDKIITLEEQERRYNQL